MAWEWLTASVTGAVGIAGIVGTAWSGAAERRLRRLQSRDTLVRERLEALYLDIIGTARYELTLSRPATTAVGDPPAQRSTDDVLLRHSKIEAFASQAVVDVYAAFQTACRSASHWDGLARARARENLPDEPTYQFPPEAEGLTVEELRRRAERHWDDAQQKYKRLVELIREELAFR
ncbi:hypothetical protein [Streptomyces sp. Ru62]|uniref:hypothetical protein n=1 Tax=Streptomyces sp. Ru62 TaxID=2080745 RepID=UPI0011B032B7|nr:hypothetical protein [Streptomyces sp. Ru62]